MEYKGTTIVVIVIFTLLFVGAVFLSMNPDEDINDADPKTARKSARDILRKKLDNYPDGRPNDVDENFKKEFIELPSGLKYRILRKSDKPKPTKRKYVIIHYKGWLDNGFVFDSSYPTNKPITLDPTTGWSVIDGWKEGAQLVGEGGMIELIIPPKLGYKDRDMGSIPPNSTLNFRMEILKVVDPVSVPQ